MENNWKNEEQLENFLNLWNTRPRQTMSHSKESWNKRAGRWDRQLKEDTDRGRRNSERVNSIIEFLNFNNALLPEYEVIDIGCGPGRFTAEFARHCKAATGTDLSDAMCKSGVEYAKDLNLQNTEFIPCDFKTIALSEMGWEKAFDLVFSCITPAVSTPEMVEKTMQMSRKWCFNGSFVNGDDELAKAIMKDVIHGPMPQRWNGRSAYALFNMLWLKGYFPRVGYFYEKGTSVYEADQDTAEKLCDNLNIPLGTKDADKVLDYLKAQKDMRGELKYRFDVTYIWILWDVTEQADRSSYEW